MDANGAMRGNQQIQAGHLLAAKETGRRRKGDQAHQRPRPSRAAKSLRVRAQEGDRPANVRRLLARGLERIIRVTRCADATILLTYQSPEHGRRVEAIFR